MSAIRPRGRLLRISRGGMALPAAPERDEDLRPSAGGQELLPPMEARAWRGWGQVGGRGGGGGANWARTYSSQRSAGMGEGAALFLLPTRLLISP